MDVAVAAAWADRPSDIALVWCNPDVVGPPLGPIRGAEAITAVADRWARGRQSVTFAQLSRRAAEVAEALDTVGCGTGCGGVVAVIGERGCPELIAAILGVWIGGCTPLVLSQSLPLPRLQTMVAAVDTLTAVLCGAVPSYLELGVGAEVHLSGIVTADWTTDGVAIKTLRGDSRDPDFQTLPIVSLDGDDPRRDAYILYTSGSTSEPKACRGTVDGLVNRCRSVGSALTFTRADTAIARAPIGFVDSLTEVVSALSTGMPVVLSPEHWADHPGALIGLCVATSSTRLTVVPALLDGILDAWPDGLPAGLRLETIVSSGAPLRPATVARLFKVSDARLVNLYGLTEVCGDVTLHVCTAQDADSTQTHGVPVGLPLSGVSVTVVTDRETQIPAKDGEVGEVCVQGMCVGRGYVNAPTLTAASFDGDRFYTNDLGYRRGADGLLVVVGRQDRVVLRGAVRVDLTEVEHVITQVSGIAQCCVVAIDSARGDGTVAALVAHVVPTRIGHDTSVLLDRLRQQVKARLPKYAWPSSTKFHQCFPLTTQGKVNTKALQELAGAETPSSSLSGWELVQGVLERHGLSSSDTRMTLAEAGGDSVIAQHLAREISEKISVDADPTHSSALMAHLLRALLDGPLGAVATCIANVSKIGGTHTSKRRRVSAEIPESSRGSPSSLVATMPSYRAVNRRSWEGEGILARTTHSAEIKWGWSVSLGKCIDASPLIALRTTDDGGALIMVGSHSKRFVAVDAESGKIVWDRQVGDRIEASAALSSCGTLVAVGCYDGALYVFRTSDGASHWQYQTGDVVKSCPAVHPSSGIMVFGSHDGLVHAVDVVNRLPLWTFELSREKASPPVLSSPAIDAIRERMIVADLAGNIASLSLAKSASKMPTQIWKRCLEHPVFSSLTITPTGSVLAATMGSEILCLDGDCGSLLWSSSTSAPLFSTPFIVPLSDLAYVGCHDNMVYCVRLESGQKVWAANLGEKVFASPHGMQLPTGHLVVICVAASGRLVVLCGTTGTSIAETHLPGEVFSSPMCWGTQIFVGCRDESIYRLDLSLPSIAPANP